MKPWSKKSQEALRTLLKFYTKKDFVLDDCPLCEAVTGTPREPIFEEVCVVCPWMVMKKNRCYDFFFVFKSEKTKCVMRTTPEVLRQDINNFVESETPLENYMEKAVEERIEQLKEWIKYYEAEE